MLNRPPSDPRYTRVSKVDALFLLRKHRPDLPLDLPGYREKILLCTEPEETWLTYSDGWIVWKPNKLSERRIEYGLSTAYA